MDTLNIQLCPTPIFYIGGHVLYRFVSEPGSGQDIGSVASIISATVQQNQFDAVADSASASASIVSALYIAPHTEAQFDEAGTLASIISATNTSTSFQRNALDSAICLCSIVSAFIFTQTGENELDSANTFCTIASATVMNSTQYALTDGTPLNVNFAHGLAAAPAMMDLRLLCTTNDAGTGMVAGQEIKSYCWFDAINLQFDFSIGADATKIYVNYTGDGGTNMRIDWNGGLKAPTTLNNFALKIYWQ